MSQTKSGESFETLTKVPLEEESIRVPIKFLKDNRFTLYEKLILSAIEQFTEYRTQGDLARKIGVSRAKVLDTHRKALEFKVFRSPRFIQGGARRGDYLPVTVRAAVGSELSGASIPQLFRRFNVNPSTCDLLKFGRTGTIGRQNYWTTYDGQHRWILKDLQTHFRSEIKRIRTVKDVPAERELVVVWQEIKLRHKRKGVTL